jgi:hypothetical protein
MSRYTKEQLRFLKNGYMSMNVRDLSRAFNEKYGTSKPETAIKAALNNHRMTCGRKGSDRLIRHQREYSDEQIAFLAKSYKAMDIKTLARSFNEKFGTNKKPDTLKAAMGNHGIRAGRTGHFKKGHSPWNTGTKGVMKPNSGNFPKGNTPPNRKPIGSERIDSKDGYIYIKVAETDPYTGFPTRYKQKHVWLWEKRNGPVPDGMCVVFKDGDKYNFDEDNFTLVTRAELLRLNHNGYKDIPGELKPTAMAMAKLEVKIFEKRKEL